MNELHSIGPMILSMIMMNGHDTSTNILIKIICICLFQCVLTSIRYLQDNIITILDPIWNSYFTKKNNIFKLQANITYRNNTIYERDITPVFKAVMHDIYSSITKINTSNKVLNYTIQDIPINYENTTSMKMVIFSNPFQLYEPCSTILIKIDHTTVIPEKVEYKYMTYTITISSKSNNYNDISKYIDKCISNYDIEQANILKSQHIFILSNVQSENNHRHEITFNSLKFDTTKTFDSMFFEEKQSIISYIDYFVNNEHKYKVLGKPYTCGLLLHGYPGTGKTSFIKALAKYTDRHIVVIPGKKVKSIDILKHIFMNENINDTVVPHNKRLYVFEEIDCNEWKNVVIRRCHTDYVENGTDTVTEKLETCMQNVIEKLLHIESPENITDIKSQKYKDVQSDKTSDLNLGEFLDLLDGIIEIPGRMIVMTSNHPEHLDPALMRPGRIDRIVEFKKMRIIDVKDMYLLWFNNISNFDAFVQEYDIYDYKYSQAEIGQIFEKIIAEKL